MADRTKLESATAEPRGGSGSRRSVRLAALLLLAVSLSYGIALWLSPAPEATQAAPRAASAANALVLQLEPAVSASRVSGLVFTVDGRGLAGASVCAVSVNATALGGPQNTCTASDESGRFTIDELSSGAYYLRAAKFGFLPGVANAGRAIVVDAGRAQTDLRITLQPGGVNLTGMVIDATGGPVARAALRATQVDGQKHMVDVQTDDDGHFALTIAPGRIALTAQAKGYTSARLMPTAPAAGLVLTLTPAGTISGHVLMAKDRRPVSGMRITANFANELRMPSGPSLPTNERGEFSLSELEAGSYYLSAEGDHLRAESGESYEVDVADSVQDVLLLVEPVRAVSGRVIVQATHTACGRGQVTLLQAEEQGNAVPTLQAFIEDDGRVHFASVPRGQYAVQVNCDNHVLVEGPKRLDIADDDLADLRWQVADGLGLSVLTVDERGHAVPYSSIQVQFPQPAGQPRGLMLVSTNGDGRYESPTVLAPGSYVVAPNGNQRGEPVNVELKPGAGRVPVRLQLAGSAALLVRVRNTAGEAVESVNVIATALDEATPKPATSSRDTSAPPDDSAQERLMRRATISRSAVAIGNGRYRIGPVAAGRYEIAVEDGVNPPALAGEGAHPTIALSEAATRELEIVIDRGASIAGQVLDDAGEPRPNVWVSAFHDAGGDQQAAQRMAALFAHPASPGQRVLSDLNGRFRLENLARGSRFEIRAEDLRGGVVSLREVQTGTDITLRFAAVGKLKGVVFSAGTPTQTPVSVQVSQPNTGWTRATFARPDGTWEFADVAAGSLRLDASDDLGHAASLAIDFQPQNTLAALQLVLQDVGSSAAPEKSLAP